MEALTLRISRHMIATQNYYFREYYFALHLFFYIYASYIFSIDATQWNTFITLKGARLPAIAYHQASMPPHTLKRS